MAITSISKIKATFFKQVFSEKQMTAVLNGKSHEWPENLVNAHYFAGSERISFMCKAVLWV